MNEIEQRLPSTRDLRSGKVDIDKVILGFDTLSMIHLLRNIHENIQLLQEFRDKNGVSLGPSNKRKLTSMTVNSAA